MSPSMLLLQVLLLLLGCWSTCGAQIFRRSDNSDGTLSDGIGPGGVLVPPSPCPGIFEYKRWGNEVVGLAMIPPPNRASTNEPINVTVILSVELLITTGYAGVVELMEDKNTVFNRLQTGDLRPIYYRIRFPLRSPIASLLLIKVNHQVVCQNNRASSTPVVTKLTLHHSLVPDRGSSPNVPNVISNQIQEPTPVSWRPDNNQQPSWQQNNQQPSWQQITQPPWQQTTQPPWQQPTQTPWQRPTQPPWQTFTQPPQNPPQQQTGFNHNNEPLNKPVVVAVHPFNSQDDDCGTPAFPPTIFLVQNGAPTSKGQWPWLVAMFVKTDRGQDFKCGGSLVSRGHVITAAHCVKDLSKAVISADLILLQIGKFNLRRAEPEAQPRDVSQIVLHPLYGSDRYTNDIAVLILETPVIITQSVRPVCLWPESSENLETIVTKMGTVVGWGKDEKGNRVTDEPKLARMPLVPQEECLRSHRDFYYLTSESTFCAGGRDGSGPCSGDSGGGMYFSRKEPDGSTRWMLRGVVSLALVDDETRECDLKNYIVFTDVAKYMPWIRNTTGSN